MTMKMVTDAQMRLLMNLSTGERVKIAEVNTMTLAASCRRGYIKPNRNALKLTELGKATYEYNIHQKYLDWKTELAQARDLKAKRGSRR